MIMEYSLKNLFLLFLLSIFIPQIARSQVTCEPIPIVGRWDENISALTSIVRGPFSLVFTGDGRMVISQFSYSKNVLVLLGEGEYRLDNLVDPKVLKITNISSPGSSETGELTLDVVSLDYSELLLFGVFFDGLMPLRFRFAKTYPAPSDPENAVATRESLYQELLTIPKTPSAVFDHFNEPLLPEIKELIANIIDLALSRAKPLRQLAGLISSSNLKNSASADRKAAYIYFRNLAMDLCGEIGRIEMEKLQHWERWEYVRAAFPSAREGSGSLDAWTEQYNQMNREQWRLEKLRRRLLLEMVILKAEDGTLEDIYRN